MRTLKHQIELLFDLKRRREIMAFRYYTSKDQSTLLDLISAELESWHNTMKIPEELLVKLSNPDRLATDGIYDLCNLYREVIIQETDCENAKHKI